MNKKLVGCIMILGFPSIGPHIRGQQPTTYVFDKMISLPGDGGYDYLSIDAVNDRLYVSHGTCVEVINLKTARPEGRIQGMDGVHGIAIVQEVNEGFITDGKTNSVIVFDLPSLKTITRISLSGKKPDAIIYDSFSRQVFAFNGNSNNISVIDIVSLKEISIIDEDGNPEFAVADGHGKIYNNIEDKNKVSIIDTKSLSVVNNYPLSPCGGPTGIAMDTLHQRLFTVCLENKGMTVINAANGNIITTLPIGAGVDAVAYDAITHLIFCSNGDGTTTIFRQESPDSYVLVQILTTKPRAKTLALDPKTHMIYLSVVDFQPGTKIAIPGSFRVLVYRPAA